MIANVPEEKTLNVCPRLYHYVRYDEKDNKNLLKTLKMTPLVLQLIPAFVTNAYVLHTGSDYPCNQNLRYHVYVVAYPIMIPSTIEFRCGGILPIRD